MKINQGALISSEIRNNTCKIAKWICQAVLSSVDTIKLGYISRTQQKDKHGILQVESQKISDLMASINFKMSEHWAVIFYLLLGC